MVYRKSLSFPELPNRLEMIGDLKATFLLKQTPWSKIRFVQIGGDSESWGSDDSIVDRDEKWQSPYPYKFSVSIVVFIVNVKKNQEVSPSWILGTTSSNSHDQVVLKHILESSSNLNCLLCFRRGWKLRIALID